jgi:hypothetical protein
VAAAPYRTTFEPESRRLILDGRVLAGDVDTLRVGTRDPVRQGGAALARTLGEAGIRLRSGWRVEWAPGESLGGACAAGAVDRCGATTVARLTSPPLLEIAEYVLGASLSGSTYMVETVGVDSLDLRLRDGSGLSAQNVATPRALVQVLDHARRTPWGAGFRDALAGGGEPGTTLANRLQDLQGRVFAKTGTLTNVTSLSGYLLRPDGSTVIFSILTNASGLGASRVQVGIDRIVRALAGGP